MIRVGLYSQDRTLQPLLSSALGKQFQILLGTTEEGIDRMLSAQGCDVVILDLDAKQEPPKRQVAWYKEIIESRFPTVIMADDSLRSMALDLVKLGAYGYCRRPPSIRDLKTILLRVHEHAALERELQSVQQRLEAASSCDRLIGSSPQMRRVY